MVDIAALGLEFGYRVLARAEELGLGKDTGLRLHVSGRRNLD